MNSTLHAERHHFFKINTLCCLEVAVLRMQYLVTFIFLVGSTVLLSFKKCPVLLVSLDALA
jgi:hypothetical protein